MKRRGNLRNMVQKCSGGERVLIFRLTLAPLLLAFNTLFSSCTLIAPRIGPDLYNQDYYFSGHYVQIQGRSTLPPMEGSRAPGDANEQLFLSLKERRTICLKEAILNSQTKWLSLTRTDPQEQSEWKLRLSLKAKGEWSGCLDSARVVRYFFDDMESCRVAVLYPCLPQNH